MCRFPDGTKVASGFFESKAVGCDEWGVSADAEGDSVKSVSFSPDGTKVASGTEDWRGEAVGCDEWDCLQTLEGHLFCDQCVVSPDGTKLASGSVDTQSICGKTLECRSAAEE